MGELIKPRPRRNLTSGESVKLTQDLLDHRTSNGKKRGTGIVVETPMDKGEGKGWRVRKVNPMNWERKSN
jgi:hypothetical protein